MNGGDFYALFGVDRLVDQAVIKKAYYALSKLYHPDMRGDQRMMVLINAAYEVLSDPIRRAAYDQSLAIVRRTEIAHNIFTPSDRPASPYLRRQKTRLWAWMTAVGMAASA